MHRFATTLAVLSLVACGDDDDDGVGDDAGAPDAFVANFDAGAVDAGAIADEDAGPGVDSGVAVDAGAPADAGPFDGGTVCDEPGASEVLSCGRCGEQVRFCTSSGEWEYGPCQGEVGICTPGESGMEACGSCGFQVARCSDECVWVAEGECTSEGECAPGERQRTAEGCDPGETRELRCTDRCELEEVEACSADECDTPGRLETVGCGFCGTVDRFCTAAGVWEYGVCEEEGVCEPGDTDTVACGRRCGSQEARCTDECRWEATGECSDEGECAPGTTTRTTEGCEPGEQRIDVCSASCAYEAGECGPCPDVIPVDLLFVIDDSGSMNEEQVALARQLPRLLTVLTTGDLDLDGTPEFTGVRDIHAGVITTDMGTPGFVVPTCTDVGDDGILRTEGNVTRAGCMASYPSFLDFDPGDEPEDAAGDFACVATAGTAGCGFEQQLEATLKAVTPSSSPIRFAMGTTGHEDGENDGFLRDTSLLGIILLTDEDDCSAEDLRLFSFDPGHPYAATDPNVRCAVHDEALHRLTRYVDGLLATRSDPGRVIFSAIVGVPPDLDGESFETILTDDRMTPTTAPTEDRLEPSCDRPGTGLAFPPRRIVEAAAELERAGAGTVVRSICSDDLAPAMGAVLARLSEELMFCD